MGSGGGGGSRRIDGLLRVQASRPLVACVRAAASSQNDLECDAQSVPERTLMKWAQTLFYNPFWSKISATASVMAAPSRR